MSEPLETARILTQQRQLGRSSPRRFSQQSRYRFGRDRRASLIRRIGGEPTERQALLIALLIEAEWNALECEATARPLTGKPKIEALRLGAEYRRQMLLLDRDLERTIRPKPAPAAPKAPSIADIIADATRNSEAPVDTIARSRPRRGQADLFGDGAE